MVKLVALVLILLGLVVFVLQNMAPLLSLTLLGFQTPALPLALWMVGAIAAGALTTLLTKTLIGMRPRRSSVKPKARRPRVGDRPTPPDAPWTPPPWTGRSAEPPKDAPRTATKVNLDDWSAPVVDDWDDWAGAEARREPRRAVGPQDYGDSFYGESATNRTVREANGSAYPEPPDFATAYRDFRVSDDETFVDNEDFIDNIDELTDAPEIAYPKEQEVWDDWDENDEIPVTYEAIPKAPSAPAEPPPPPPRDIIEIRRNPQVAAKTGTLYSFTYRRDDPDEAPSDEAPSVETSSVETPSTENPSTAASAPSASTGRDPGISSNVPSKPASVTTPLNSAIDSPEDTSAEAFADSSSPAEARVRVIIPPYPSPQTPLTSAPAQTPSSQTTSSQTTSSQTIDVIAADVADGEENDDEEAWGEEDSWDEAETWDEEAQDSGTWEDRAPARAKSAGAETAPEVWDDWDEEEPPDRPAPDQRRGRSPEGNPPLNL